jgi:hypothetical protein
MTFVNLFDTSMWAAPSETPILRQRLSALAARVQAPRLMSYAHVAAGYAHIHAVAEPDFGAAVPDFEKALALAQRAGDVRYLGVAVRALAVAASGAGALNARQRCSEALTMLYDVRYWQKLWQAADDAALALAEAGHCKGASTLLGHLDAHTPSYGLEHQLGFRDRARRALIGHEDPAAAAAGARMSADEIVLAAIEWCSE